MLRTTRLLTMMFVGTPWGSHRWAQAFAPVPPMRDPTIHRSSHRAKSCIPAVETTGSPAERFSRRSLEARAMAERPNARHRRPSCLYALGVGGAHGMSLRTTSLGSLSCAFSMYGSSSHWRRRDSVRRVALSWIRARSLPTLREAESPGDPSPGEGYEIPRSSRKMESGEGAMLPGVDEDEEVNGETSGDMEQYEEIVANMTKPLGITIEASTDNACLVYVTSVGEQAEDAGLRVGDVVTGVSGVFGEDVWSVKGKTVEKIRSMVRCRSEPYVLVRVERGHVSLEERCAEGFGLEHDEDGVAFCTVEDEEDDEQEFMEMWGDYYRDEVDVMGQPGLGKKTGQAPARSTAKATEALDYPGDASFGRFSERNW